MRIFPKIGEDILYDMWNHQPSTMWKLGTRIISWSSCLSYPLYEELWSMYTVRWSLVRILLTFRSHFSHRVGGGINPRFYKHPIKNTCAGLLVTGLYSSGGEKDTLKLQRTPTKTHKPLTKKIKCHHEKTRLLNVGTAPDAINLIHMQHRT